MSVEWQNYVQDATSSTDGRNLARICIIEVNQEKWVASDDSLKPTPDQMMKLWHAFHMKLSDKKEIQLGAKTVRTFYIEKNDGFIMETVGGKNGNVDEIMCVARTKQYVILCGQSVENDNGKCLAEVKHVREHLMLTEGHTSNISGGAKGHNRKSTGVVML